MSARCQCHRDTPHDTRDVTDRHLSPVVSRVTSPVLSSYLDHLNHVYLRNLYKRHITFPYITFISFTLGMSTNCATTEFGINECSLSEVKSVIIKWFSTLNAKRENEENEM